MVSCCTSKIENAKTETVIACLVDDYFPEPVSISWNSGQITKEAKFFPAVQSKNERYTKTSQLTIPSSSLQSSSSYQCNVEHKLSGKNISKSFPADLCAEKTAEPQVRILPPSCEDSSTEKPLELICLFLNLGPGKANVEWFVNGVKDKTYSLNVDRVDDANGLNVGYNRIKLTKQAWDNENVYTCKVTHPKIAGGYMMYNTSKCSACLINFPYPSIYITKPSYEDVLANTGLVTCLVLASDLSGADIKWEVDGRKSPNGNTGRIQTHNNGTQTRLSSHQVTLKQWNSISTFTCKVKVPCYEEMKEQVAMSEKNVQRKTPSVTISRAYREDASGNRVAILLICEVSGFSPKEISISWQKNNAQEPKSHYNNGPVYGNDLYSTESILKVDKGEGPAIYTCVVQHPTLKTPDKVTANVSFDFLEPAPPQVTVSHAPDIGGHEKLTCFTTGFYPKDIDIYWMVKKEMQNCTFKSPLVALADGKFQQTCELLISAEDWSTVDTYTCIVTHSSLTGILEKTLRSTGWQISAANSSLIEPPSLRELFVNKTAAVTCKTQLVNASIQWMMNEQPMDLRAVRSEEPEKQNVSTWIQSWLQVNLSEWNSTKKVSCLITSNQEERKLDISLNHGPWKAPSTYLLPASSDTAYKDQSLTLFCIIKDFYPKDVSVWWQKDEVPIDMDRQPQNDHPSCDHQSQRCSLVSKLEVSRTEWLLGTTYTCLVAHMSSEVILERSVNAYTDSWDCSIMNFSLCGFRDDNEDDYTELDDGNCVWTTVSTFIALFLVMLFYSGFVTFIKVK
ncbi:hypothetical protein Y1Q_0005950 [Alligator mississippiensis]|uniref:Ig-like domain-containing protein n=1 Tax=Alligator mississippiensis TaxID=8496 RepID=A0A151MYV8_ALLMI|nr:hypothetical protein Y1Q_0005950 [Alligator mississippiensis]